MTFNAEISVQFNLVFSQCSTSIYQAFDGKTEFSWVFNLILEFYTTCESHENFMHAEIYVLQFAFAHSLCKY